MQHTTNYNLNQWEATDRVTREAINADNAAIDAALAAAGGAKAVAGYYTGNGATTRTISLGFTPTGVFVCDNSGHTVDINDFGNYYYGGLAVTDKPMKAGSNEYLGIVSGGFRVMYKVDNNSYYSTNNSGAVYRYIAIS